MLLPLANPVLLKRWGDHAIVVLSALFPVILIADLGNVFYNDWWNHVWFIGYFGHFIQSHHQLPVTINTNETIGLAFPVFYGYTFFSVGGLIANIVGSNVAVRLMLAGIAILVASQVYSSARILSGSRSLALVLAFVVSSAPYQLTNIFSRGDLPEYIAGSLVLSATMAWLRFALAEQPSSRAAWSAGLLYALGASVHPITALLGGVFCVTVFLLTAFVGHRIRRTLIIGIPLTALVVAFLSPWLYAVSQYAHQMNIVRGNVLLYFNGIDDVWNRLSFIPQDPRVTILGVDKTPFAYLDLQINMALAVVIVTLGCELIHKRQLLNLQNRTLGASVGLVAIAAVVVIASGVPSFGAIVFHAVALMQFAYRSITYVDLMLLATAMILATALRPFGGSRPSNIMFAGLFVAAGLAFHSDIVKIAHSIAIEGRATVPGSGNPSAEAGSVNAPPGLPVVTGGYYAAPGAFVSNLPLANRSTMVTVHLPVADGAQFGDVGQSTTSSSQDGLLQTNIEGFPWSALVIDGEQIARAQTIVTPSAPRMNVVIKPGAHVLTYKLAVDERWSMLRVLALVALGIWILLIRRSDRPGASVERNSEILQRSASG